MSLRLTPYQAAEIVALQEPRPADSLFPNRRAKMAAAICVTCGKNEGFLDFVDGLSLDEWCISGMCQSCQDAFWAEDEA